MNTLLMARSSWSFWLAPDRLKKWADTKAKASWRTTKRATATTMPVVLRQTSVADDDDVVEAGSSPCDDVVNTWS